MSSHITQLSIQKYSIDQSLPSSSYQTTIPSPCGTFPFASNLQSVFKSGNVFSMAIPLSQNKDSIFRKLIKAHLQMTAFIQALSQFDTLKAQALFQMIPNDCKQQLLAAVLKKEHYHSHLGSEASDENIDEAWIMRNIFVLQEPCPQLIAKKGNSLSEQLLYDLENKIKVHFFTESLKRLTALSEQLNLGQSARERQLQHLKLLPKVLKWEMQKDLEISSRRMNLDLKPGKTLLLEDPTVLLSFKHPDTDEFIIDTYIRLCKQQLAILTAPIGPPTRSPEAHKTHPKLYELRGAQYLEGQTTFCVYAPNAKEVAVVLTAFGNVEQKLQMEKGPDGVWKAVTDAAPPGRSYLYEVIDVNGHTMLRMDPFSFTSMEIQEVGQFQSVVTDPNSFHWNDADWIAERKSIDPKKRPLSIYELQLKSWKKDHASPFNFKKLASDVIEHCKLMNHTHIELYGLMEHYHPQAGGYQVSNFFAPFHGNGSSNDLKYFIDKLHENRIGVILDWIPTHFHHFHQSREYSGSIHEFDGTNLFAAEPSDWGTLYLDYSKEETCRLMEASALYFLDHLHFDGLRVDAVSRLVHRNGQNIPHGIQFLQQLNNTVHDNYPGVLMIAEETDGFPGVTQTTGKGGLGFDLKWNVGWSYDSREFLKTSYSKRSTEWDHKIIRLLHEAAFGEEMISTHSHDESDAGDHNDSKTLWSCVSHLSSDDERFANLRNFFSWQMLGPGRGKLIHMGDENVQPESAYSRFSSLRSAVDWTLIDRRPAHAGVQKCISNLNKLYLYLPQLSENGEENFRLIYQFKQNLIVGYQRRSPGRPDITVIHNFSNQSFERYDIHNVPFTGSKKIHEIFNSNQIEYGGSGNCLNRDIQLIPTAGNPTMTLAIPANSTIVLQED